MTAARWLFLDFDGVVHANFPRRDRTDAQNKRWAFVPTLEAVMRQHPAVEIVIASTWRRDHPLAKLKGFFSPDIARRIVGATPLHSTHGYGTRQDEVEAWLAAHGHQHEPWVALDDVVDLYRTGACVVVADDGFQAAEAAALDAALSDPAAWAATHPVPTEDAPRTLWTPTG